MKKLLCSLLSLVVFFTAFTPSAKALDGTTIKVGLRYGDSAMFAANLENAKGEGYEFGFYDDQRQFVSLGATTDRTITTIASGTIYMNENRGYTDEMPSGSYWVLGGFHAQLTGYSDFAAAQAAATQVGGWPAYINNEYVVRAGSYDSQQEAEQKAAELGGTASAYSDTGFLVADTGTEKILFEYDCGGHAFGVMPTGWDQTPVTWFRNNRYKGGFEYARKPGGYLSVINVLDLEDYVKGVVPYEMSSSWPMAALEAQAVCARTFAVSRDRHLRTDGFDVCDGHDCQTYLGVREATAQTDAAVDNTKGQCIYYNDRVIPNAVYHASNGGATEDVKNVWGGTQPYLRGKLDPYEASIQIPNYSWTVTYTASELTWILEQKEYQIGQVQDVFVSEYTPNGNVKEITFIGSRGTLKVTGERCRTIFYSSTYQKSVKSQRFSINGGGPGGAGVCVNTPGQPLESLAGISVLSASGTIEKLPENSAVVMTASGAATVAGVQGAQPPAGKKDSFTITGTGNGHNVGLSQFGAKAMAEQGFTYQEILEFYYTDVTIR